MLENKTFTADFNISGNGEFEALCFQRHLYQPLLWLNAEAFKVEDVDMPIRIVPIALNQGERDFIKHLRAYYDGHPDFFKDKSLYLLRNKSRKGIGFFYYQGFYPDFILWLVSGRKQYISFIDPKGLRNIKGFDDPKIRLAETIRADIEPQLNDPDVILNSFIISITPFNDIRHWSGTKDITDFNNRHVYFQKDQKHEYIDMLMKAILGT